MDSLKDLKSRFPNILGEITKENVNNIISVPFGEMTLLEFVLRTSSCDAEKIVPLLLSMGAKVTPKCFIHIIASLFPILLEAGADPNCFVPQIYGNDIPLISHVYSSIYKPYCTLLIDYGAKIPPGWEKYWNRDRGNIMEYAHLSKRRVTVCRWSIVALWVYCRSGIFRPLAGIFHQFSKQMLHMLGGRGCGPRSKEWI